MDSQRLALLDFGLKLENSRTEKRVFVSAGKPEDKVRLLPALKRLRDLNAQLFATAGTSAFLSEHGVTNVCVDKIHESPDVRSMLEAKAFDLVINVLTGNADYDENSDARIIRNIALERDIHFITDVDVALVTIDRVIAKVKNMPKPGESRDMWEVFRRHVRELHGYSNWHGHIDKAGIITVERLELAQALMEEKWTLMNTIKQSEDYFFENIVRRGAEVLEDQLRFGSTYVRTMVDADTQVGLKCAKAALELKKAFAGRIDLEIGTQPLEGVMHNREARKYYEEASSLLDFLGGLPSRDRPLLEGHLDFILGLGKSLGKTVDVHVDQQNNPDESETELLALKTIEHGMEGRVNAIHSISLACKEPHEQLRVAKMLKDAGIRVLVCPAAAISMKPVQRMTWIHNSIAPVRFLVENGVPVGLGADNIRDIFQPVVDGNMESESRLFMEACRWYDLPAIADIACAKPN